MVAILGVLEFLANRYNKSYDSTSNKKFTLSEQTEKIARNLTQTSRSPTGTRAPRISRMPRTFWTGTKNLSRKIDVQYQDVDKKRTEALAAGVKPIPNIFVEVGNKKDQAKGLTEEDITGAIVRVLKGGDRKVCFTIGSGEHDTDNTDKVRLFYRQGSYRKEQLQDGSSPAADQARNSGGLHHRRGARAQARLPAAGSGRDQELRRRRRPSADPVGPSFKFAAAQVDDNTALTDVLTGWGVTAQKDLVLDLSGVGQLYGVGPEMAVIMAYDSQPIVNDMKDVWTALPAGPIPGGQERRQNQGGQAV